LRKILPSSGLDLGPEEAGHKAYNYSTYDITHKISKTQNKIIFLHCRLQDLLSLLRVWTAF